MFSKKQCELARIMVNDNISDNAINDEFEKIDPTIKNEAVQELDDLLK